MADTKDKNLESLMQDVLQEEQSQEVAADFAVEDINTDAVLKEAAKIEKYSGRPIAAGAAGLARGVSLGLSDVALTKSGLVEPETLAGLEEENTGSSIGSEILGTIAPAFVPGGQAAPAGAVFKAGKLATQASEKALASILKETGRKKFAQAVLKKTLPEIAGSAVEGAALGAGQLISEDALGKAEFNGQNLMAHMGGGAILGGGAGLAIGGAKVVLPGIKGAFGQAKGKLAKAAKKFTSAEEAAMELTGLTPAKELKLLQRNPNFKQDLLNYYKKDIGVELADNAEDLVRKNLASIDKNGKAIGSALKRMDEAADTVGYKIERQPLFDSLKQRLNPYLDRTAAKEALGDADLRKLTQFEDTLDAYAKRKGSVSFGELNKLKQSLDDAAKFDVTKTNFEREIARDLRHAVRQEVESLGDKLNNQVVSQNAIGFENLVTTLKDANKSYSVGVTVRDSLQKKALKDSDFLSLKDLVTFGAGGLIDPTLGGLTVLAGKALKSDFRRKISILADIERANQATTKAIKDSSSAFVNSTKSAKKPIKSSLGVLANSQLSVSREGVIPKTRRSAYNNLRQNVNEQVTDLDSQAKRVALNTLSVSHAAPNTAVALADSMNRALSFLHSKLPQDNQGIETQLFKRQYEPSDFELAKFERYLQAIEAPLTLLDELQAGTLTQEHVEALREVYPDIYGEIRNALTEQIVEADKPLPYNKKIAISTLFDITADESMAGDFIIAMQTNFEPEQQEPQGIQPTAGAAQKINIAGRSETDIQRIQSGKQS